MINVKAGDLVRVTEGETLTKYWNGLAPGDVLLVSSVRGDAVQLYCPRRSKVMPAGTKFFDHNFEKI